MPIADPQAKEAPEFVQRARAPHAVLLDRHDLHNTHGARRGACAKGVRRRLRRGVDDRREITVVKPAVCPTLEPGPSSQRMSQSEVKCSHTRQMSSR
jgi:hypothetical protein